MWIYVNKNLLKICWVLLYNTPNVANTVFGIICYFLHTHEIQFWCKSADSKKNVQAEFFLPKSDTRKVILFQHWPLEGIYHSGMQEFFFGLYHVYTELTSSLKFYSKYREINITSWHKNIKMAKLPIQQNFCHLTTS